MTWRAHLTLPAVTALVALLVLCLELDLPTSPSPEAPATSKTANFTPLLGVDKGWTSEQTAMLPVALLEPSAGPSDAASTLPELDPAPPPEQVMACEDDTDGLLQAAQELIDRRKDLERRESDLTAWEQDVHETADKVLGHLASIKQYREEISELLREVDAEEERRIARLVKVYETMKAKKAAEIFDRLELGDLLAVMRRMREAKAAAILAAMNPAKAKQATAEMLAERMLP